MRDTPGQRTYPRLIKLRAYLHPNKLRRCLCPSRLRTGLPKVRLHRCLPTIQLRSLPWLRCVFVFLWLYLLPQAIAQQTPSLPTFDELERADLLPQTDNQEPTSLPTLEELETLGAIIGNIEIDNQNIFDLDDPKENNVLFRLANKVHVRTRKSVIKRILLFKSGEPLTVQLIEESERLLFSSGFLYDATIRPTAYNNGVVDLKVTTRDTWTLDPGIGFTRSGGDNTTRFGLTELNLFGSGVGIGYRQRNVDGKQAEEFEILNPQLFGTRARLNYLYEQVDEGDRQLISLIRPFYELDARWSAGISTLYSDTVASNYSNGVITEQYRIKRNTASVFGGWSKGLIDGWTRRYTIGLDYTKEENSVVPDQAPPSPLPADDTRVAPFFRFDLVEDNFARLKNRDQIERAEYFALGFRADMKIGYAATALGSTRPAWIYAAGISNGVEMRDERILVGAASVSGVYTGGNDENQLFTGGLKYYVPQSDRALTYFAISGDAARDIDTSAQLALGGNNGLPGYPTDYQRGNRRVLLNIEQRLYTDWYPFRLFRVGGAVFFNAGSAWGEKGSDSAKPDWLADVGFGLRIFSVRSAFGTVWHLDFAFPVNPPDGVPDYQVLILSRRSF